MRGYAWILLFVLINVCEANIDKDIAANKDKLAKTQSQEKAISKKFDELGKAINAKNIELTQLGHKITQLEKDIAQNQGKYQTQEKTLKQTQEKQNRLLKQKQNIETQLIKLITQSIAFNAVINNQSSIDSIDDVIEFHIYEILYRNTKTQVKKFDAQQTILNNEIKRISSTINQLQTSIKTQTTRKETLQNAKDNQKAILAKMQTELKVYDQQLKDIAKERKSLDDILAKLNIIKERDQQGKATNQQAFINNQKKPNSIKAPKQLGTSYRDVPIVSYKGAKTFPPLERYTIEKKFGPYFDPVYQFKIFNAAIMFNPKSPNASVKNVLDGKVVYAKDAPGLKKVIIIEHINAIHTIYAYLDKIESSIKAGMNIKKGTIIGKVNERLSFEVTQKDKHINPAEFIKLN
ncbi:metallopeptidase [Helicobacter sp. MIT 05-5293]|uniref:murein hydrolase activator EnvC family protein n=1 Tax=Helicobacter sp. MIT 05-5293 TaxID=1548149 RepID=UPI00051DAEE8|nr:peptidoglycan DD-metalloendopeptidase family protein [Helicobacter sp. MIT 05-5293]TLD80218.1 metallopeptidase [Helicobacter sp. MIT 05-5293]